MGLLITTQSYRNDVPTEYGLLLEVDTETGELIRQKRIDTPVKAAREGDRVKPGLRGLFLTDTELYTTSWNTIFVLDRETWEVTRTLSHKWMSDLHGIYVNDNGIWVNSSLPDGMILYDQQGNPKSAFWLPESKYYTEQSEVDKSLDWRYIGKNFRGFKDYHNNHVTIRDGWVYITGRGKESNTGRVLRAPESAFLNQAEVTDKDVDLWASGLFGPHDGFWHGEEFWVTETLGSNVAAMNAKGKVVFRQQVKAEKTDRQPGGSLKRLKTKIRPIFGKPGEKVAYWTRGMVQDANYIYVAQSTWAGDAESRARVVVLHKDSKEVARTFYLDIPDYPETRIFQLGLI